MTVLIWHEEDNTLETAPSIEGRGGIVVADPVPADYGLPGVHYHYDGTALVRDLTLAKEIHKERIKAARDTAMMDNVVVEDVPATGVSSEFQLRASTPNGKSGFDFIMGYVGRAESALLREATYQRPFKLADNTIVMFNAEQWVAIGDRIENVMQQRFAHAEQFLAAIDAATSVQQMEQVQWTPPVIV